MKEARRLGIGKVSIHGEAIDFVPEAAVFRVAANEDVELMLQYDYREASHDREHVRLTFKASIDGQDQGTDEREIEDRPYAIDDKRGFLSVPLRTPGAGSHKGRFEVIARYAKGGWNKGAQEEWILERDGDFTLEVEGSRTHRV